MSFARCARLPARPAAALRVQKAAPLARNTAPSIPSRAASTGMWTTGISRTTIYGQLETDVNQYAGWYSALVSLLKGNVSQYFRRYMGYRRLGLRFEDTFLEDEDVMEALRRLPADVIAARDNRIKRALVLTGRGDILPQEEWTTDEEDVAYLKPYLAQVVSERRDRQAFRPKG